MIAMMTKPTQHHARTLPAILVSDSRASDHSLTICSMGIYSKITHFSREIQPSVHETLVRQADESAILLRFPWGSLSKPDSPLSVHELRRPSGIGLLDRGSSHHLDFRLGLS